MKVLAITTLIVVMGGWALVLCLMVRIRMKHRAETLDLEKDSPPPMRPDFILVPDGPEIDLSGDADEEPAIFDNY